MTRRPHVGESAKAFAWRLASSNGYTSPSHMLKRQAGSSEQAELMRLYRENLREEDVALLAGQAERCDSRYILKADFRVCPLCYQDKPCLLDEWQYALMPYCAVHNELLVKAGPLSRLTWSPIDTALSERQSDAPCTAVFALQGVLRTAIGFDDAPNPEYEHLQHLYADQLHKLVLLIGAFKSAGQRIQPRKLPFKAEPLVAAAILKSGAECLAAWPDGIGAFLADSVGKEPESRSVRRRVGGLYRAVQKGLCGNEFEFFRNAFYEEIARRWPEAMDSKGSAAKGRSPSTQGHVSGTAFAKRIGVSTNTVAQWIESKKISGSIRSLDTGRRQLSVKPGQIDKTRRLVRYLSLIDVASALGLKKDTVRGLIRVGHISAHRAHPTAPWRIDKEVPRAVKQTLREGAIIRNASDDTKSLDEMMRFHVSSDVTQLHIITAILRGELPYVYTSGASGLCQSIQLDKAKLIAWALGSDMLTIPAVAKRLRIKQEVAYHIVNVGILESVDKGRFGRMITPASLSLFEDTYIWCRDVASNINASAKKTASMLTGLGISPVSGPGVDGGRQLLYARSDIRIDPSLCAGTVSGSTNT